MYKLKMCNKEKNDGKQEVGMQEHFSEELEENKEKN